MYKLFCEMWMQELAILWNSGQIEIINDADMNIGYGFIGFDDPIGVLIISNNKAVSAGFTGQNLDLDVRADITDWKKWLIDEITLSQLGLLIVQKELQFIEGNYNRILCIPCFATIFFHSFKLMSKIPTEFTT